MKKTVVMIMITLTAYGLADAEPIPTIAPDSPPPVVSEVSLEQVTKQVMSGHNASRVLSAKTEEIDGRKAHIIKILTPDGRIQQQTFAADTGALLDTNQN